MTEEEETTEDIRRGLYRELIEIAERLELKVARDIESGHINDAINTALSAYKVITFAAEFKE